jgi:hypothetical protein
MPIMAITAGIGAGGSILSGIFGGKAAKKAAGVLNAQGQASGAAVNNATTAGQSLIAGGTAAGQSLIAGGTANANQILSNQANNLSGIYQPLNANLNPYLQAGTMGANNLMGAVAPGGSLSQQFSFDPSQIYSNPAYQFNMQQGLQGVQRSAASTGDALGAGTQKSMAQFASGLASNQYNTAYNQALTTYQTNRTNTMQNLQALLGTGQFGTQQANQLGTTQAGQGNQLAMGGAQNTMQGAMGGAQLGLQGTEAGAQLGLQGTEAAQNFLMQGAGANAAGIVGSTNAYNSILPGVSNAIGGYGMSQMYGNAMNGGGGGYGGGNANWAANPGANSYDTATGAYGGYASQPYVPVGPGE